MLSILVLKTLPPPALCCNGGLLVCCFLFGKRNTILISSLRCVVMKTDYFTRKLKIFKVNLKCLNKERPILPFLIWKPLKLTNGKSRECLSIISIFFSPYLQPQRAPPLFAVKKEPRHADFTWQPREQRQSLKGKVARTVCCH